MEVPDGQPTIDLCVKINCIDETANGFGLAPTMTSVAAGAKLIRVAD